MFFTFVVLKFGASIKMKKLLVCSYICILFASCSDKQQQTEKFMNRTCYTIDLDGSKEISIPYSSIFKNARTIILEFEEDCMIGRIDELQVFDECFYILDRFYAKSLFVFDMEGKFLRKIGSLGQGPGEYIRISDFTIDTENRFIFLLDNGRYVHKYRLDGTYISSITMQMPRTNSLFIQFYNNRLYSSVRAYTPAPDDYMLVEIDPNTGKLLSKSLPLKYNKGWAELVIMGHSFFMSRLGSPPRYAQLYMDTIMSIGEYILPYIELKSKNLVTEKDIDLANFQKQDMDGLSFLDRNSKIWDVHSFVENDNIIIFKYRSGSRGSHFSVVFHKETESVRIAKYLSNDMVLKPSHDWFVNFRFADKQGVYEISRPQDIQEFIRDGKVVSKLDKLDQLINLNEESNPVIFYYEFK